MRTCVVLLGGPRVCAQNFQLDNMVFRVPQPNRAAMQCVDITVYNLARHKEIADVRT